MPTIKFTVDSALLMELGERLVGKPYIALAELVKNSYDADATKVVIELNPEKDSITVSDNGHGMDFSEFRDFWMRIGSTHKESLRFSRNFKRSMTGSKGVGRLAVQFLAKKLDIATVSEKDLTKKLISHVEWEEAAKAKDLTDVEVEYDFKSSKDFEPGTKIILSGLKHEWNTILVQGLAKEIWWLQPPFRSNAPAQDSKKAFEIVFVSSERGFVDTFNWQIRAVMDIWYAKLVGKNDSGKVNISLQFAGENPITTEYFVDNCKLKQCDFEIRIYHLYYRQPYGIMVGDARVYLNEFGGVHVYDGGFHLPYYGNPENDWLRIGFDQSHRLSVSKILPAELQVEGGMSFLPTLSRVVGVVNVNTTKEHVLKILITRDKLQDSEAYRNLVFIVRWALDFYASEEARRTYKSEKLMSKIEPRKFEKLEDALIKYKSEIPEKVFENIRTDMKKASDEVETEAETTKKRIGMLGSLATAGMSSLAYQHELKRIFHTIDEFTDSLAKLKTQTKDENLRYKLGELENSLLSWAERAKTINALFAYFGDPENIKMKKRFSAKKIVNEIKEQVQVLARGIPVDTNTLDNELLLPKASLAEWGSIFQNVFINAFNALVDSEKKNIQVSARVSGGTREILIQDTGCGVDLKDAETLFEPFERRVKISPERRALGYGGMGLGLTIVRLVANNIGCDVSFVPPEDGFNTAFSIKWREAQ
jgi:signal transduction histidine kinase